MIINMRKYLIFGAKEDLDPFFEAAQDKALLEFISPNGKTARELPLEIQNLHAAIRILKKLPVKKAYEGEVELVEAQEIDLRILELKQEIERLSEEKRLVDLERARVAPFGDFSLEDIDFIEKQGTLQIKFFCRKTAKSNVADVGEGVIYIGTEYDLDYFVAVYPDLATQTPPDMIEMRIDRPLGELRSHFYFISDSLHQLEAELKGYAGHIRCLNEAYIEHLNGFHLGLAKKQVSTPLGNSSLFAIEAWVPSNKIQRLYAMIDGMAIHCEPILIESEDRVPTYLENRGVPRVGEDLVYIYDIPATTDKDPSGFVFWFFALFFAMIVADGGYGMVYLGLCLYLKWKFPNLKAQGRRLLKLATILSSACILWGVATSSFFGMQIQPNSWVGKLSIVRFLAVNKGAYHLAANDDVKALWVERFPTLATAHSGQEFLDGAVVAVEGQTKYAMLNAFSDQILLELSLIIGVIHIAVGFFRYLFRHWAGIGWIAFMVGSYLYFPSILNATSILHFLNIVDKEVGAAVGLQLIYLGVILAIVLAVVQKRLKGFGEVANLVQVFADVLSYLRLYALGLAGSMMAETFNEMGQRVGLVLGVIVILFGHGVNVSLGIMAGMIHGLRLNFIEWYHYCFDGGGRLFRPLTRLKP